MSVAARPDEIDLSKVTDPRRRDRDAGPGARQAVGSDQPLASGRDRVGTTVVATRAVKTQKLLN